MAYPDTYYIKTQFENKNRASLNGDQSFETVVIGAGLAGLTTALQLARSGHKTCLVEAKTIGFGASGRNGGFVSPGYATSYDDIAQKSNKDTAHILYKMSIEGVDFVRQNIADLGIEAALPVPGIMSMRRYDDDANVHKYVEQMAAKFDYKLDYLSKADVQNMLKTERYYQGVNDPVAFHIQPLNYLRGLALEFERLGGVIYENTPALACDVTGKDKIISSQNGKITAKNIVVATGGYTTNLFNKIFRAFLPIATYVMVSEKAPDLLKTAIQTLRGIGDNRRAGDYYRLVENGDRLLWGGRISTRAASEAGLIKELRSEMIGTYPQLHSLKTELAWSGFMSYSRHLMPQIGKLQDNIWFCTAFGGHGLNTTAIAGKVIAEAVLNETDRYKHFEKFGLDWTGGAIGLAAAQLVYWKLRAFDKLKER